MKRKTLAVGLAIVLSLSMSLTSIAASSSTGSNSGSNQTEQKTESGSNSGSSQTKKPSTSKKETNEKGEAVSVEKAAPGQNVAADKIKVPVVDAAGNVSTVSYEDVIEKAVDTVKETVKAVEQSIAAVTNQLVADSVLSSLPEVNTPEAQAKKSEAAVAAVESMFTTPVSPIFKNTIAALAAQKGSSMAINNCGTKKTLATAQDAFGNKIATVGNVKNVVAGVPIMLMSVNADGTIEYVEGVVDPATGSVMGIFKGEPVAITVLVFA